MMSPPNLKATLSKVDSNEILDVLGPLVQFLTGVSDSDEDYCLMRGTVPAGVVVPLHSHAERETFYVLEGEVQTHFLRDRQGIIDVNAKVSDCTFNLRVAEHELHGT